MRSGIYIIKNEIDNKVYIGSTTDFNSRKSYHFGRLKHNTHDNPRMQNSYNNYSPSDFQFYILETCEQEDLIDRENYWMDYYVENFGRDILFNSTPNATQKGKIVSKETREKLSISKLGEKNPMKKCVGELNHQFGIGRKVKQFSTDGIFIAEYMTLQSAAKALGKPEHYGTYIGACCRGEHSQAYGFIWKYAD